MNNIKHHHYLKLLLPITFVIFCLIVAVILTSILDYHDSDFGYYWVGSRMVLEGQDPYKPEQWITFAKSYGADTASVISYAYPMPMILLFMPLAALDLLHAAVIWIFLMSIMVLSSIIWLLRRFENDRLIHIIPPLVIGILFFRPVINTFYHGQMTSLIFFVITLSAYLIYRNKWIAGAAVLSLLLLKPQVGLPVMGLAGLWFLCRRQWKAILSEAVASIIFLVPSFIYQPNWVVHWLSSGKNSLDVVFNWAPTLWGLSMLACQGQSGCGLSLAVVLVVVALAFGVYLILRFRNEEAFFIFGIIVCTVVLITPYLLSIDQIYLLLPFLTVVQKLHKFKFPYLVIALSTILLALLSFGLVVLVMKLQSDAPSSLVTIFILAATTYALTLPKAYPKEHMSHEVDVTAGV